MYIAFLKNTSLFICIYFLPIIVGENTAASRTLHWSTFAIGGARSSKIDIAFAKWTPYLLKTVCTATALDLSTHLVISLKHVYCLAMWNGAHEKLQKGGRTFAVIAFKFRAVQNFAWVSDYTTTAAGQVAERLVAQITLCFLEEVPRQV
jgi:hypothetical protein